MKIHFVCSTAELGKYANNYLAICQTIKDLGHSISRDWVGKAIEHKTEDAFEIDREDIYKKSVESLLSSDLIITEGTISSFSVGHQITLALNRNKPVLFLTYKDKKSKNYFKHKFIDGIKTPFLTIAEYDFNNLKDVLEDFINKNKSGATTKFNIVITKEIDNYLDWARFTYNKNKSEYIREIIKKHMNESDKKYQKYISSMKKGGI